MDTPDYGFQSQVGSAIHSSPQGWMEALNWEAYAVTLPTLADELERLPRPADFARSIYVLHMPPAGLGLDVCLSGSLSVLRALRGQR